MRGWRNDTPDKITIKCPAEKDGTKGQRNKRERVKKNQGVKIFNYIFDKKPLKKSPKKKSAYSGNYFPESDT